jgi:hypothetical protein
VTDESDMAPSDKALVGRRGPVSGLSNNGMHQTGREGVALRLPRPVVEARPAGDAGCCAGTLRAPLLRP